MRKGLIEGIKQYISDKEKLITKSKVNDKSEKINQQKKVFFEKILTLLEKNQLTSARLTNELINLSSDQRQLLFHYSRSFGISIQSQAAILLRSVYQVLGIRISKKTMKLIINDNFSKDKLLKEKLVNFHYQDWVNRPNSALVNTRQRLENELKHHLQLINLDGADQKNLAAVIALDLEKEKEVTRYRKLKSFLEKIDKLAPKFLGELIADLDSHYRALGEEKYQDFVKLINDFLKDDKLNSKIKNLLLNTSAELSHQIFDQDKNLFFDFNDITQREIFSKIKQGDLEFINQEAIRRLKKSCTNFVEFSKKEEYKDQKIEFDKLEEKFFLERANDKQKEEFYQEIAINRIQAYLKTKPNSYKTKFFEELIIDIKSKGFTIDTLKNSLDENADINRLFASRFGRLRSKAAQCFFDLCKMATGETLDDQTKKNLVNTKKCQIDMLSEKSGRDYIISQEIIKQINLMANNPKKIKKSKLSDFLLKEINQLNNCLAVLNITDLNNYKKFAIKSTKEQKLIDNALEQAKKNPAAIRYDLQGNLLFEIEDNENITLLNIDIVNKKPFFNYLIDKIKQFGKKFFSKDNDTLGKALTCYFSKKDSLGNIIQLQQEA